MRVFVFLACFLTATLTMAQDNIILRSGEEISAKVLEVNIHDLKYRKTANPDGPIYTASLRDVLLIKYANGTKDSFGGQPSPLTGSGVRPEMRGRGRDRFKATDSGNTQPSTAPSGLGALRYRSRWLTRQYVGANGQSIGMGEAKSLMRLQPDAMTALGRGRSLRTWSIVSGASAVALVGVGVGIAAFGNGNGRRDGNRNQSDNNMNTPNPAERGRRNGGGYGLAGVAVASSGILLGLTSVWLDHRATVQFRRAANQYNNRPATSLRFAPASQSLGLGMTLRF